MRPMRFPAIVSQTGHEMQSIPRHGDRRKHGNGGPNASFVADCLEHGRGNVENLPTVTSISIHTNGRASVKKSFASMSQEGFRLILEGVFAFISATKSSLSEIERSISSRCEK